MKEISRPTLKKILNREIKFLIDGVSNSLNPYHFFSLSTLNHKKVTSRTIVLRNVDKDHHVVQLARGLPDLQAVISKR